MRITARYTFESAHRLCDPALSDAENAALYGPCSRTHGHTYRLEVTLSGEALEHGMLVNFADLDALVKRLVIERLDHREIAALPHFRERPCTVEELTRWVWDELAPHFADRARLEQVTVFEGERFSATVDRQAMKRITDKGKASG
jgi:6-pyruvoyltetrahydropterin/6-carboxytetrahydropterin synthase